jgi:anti-anti-sigma factor
MEPLTRTLVIIVLDGELDIATAPGLTQRLAPVAWTGSVLVLDLAAVRFCDCAGLSMFLRLRRLASASGGSLHLAAPTAAVRRLIVLAQLDEVLPLAASAAEVISALGRDPALLPPIPHPAGGPATACLTAAAVPPARRPS